MYLFKDTKLANEPKWTEEDFELAAVAMSGDLIRLINPVSFTLDDLIRLHNRVGEKLEEYKVKVYGH